VFRGDFRERERDSFIRVNYKIRATEIRVIDAEGKMVGVVQTRDAIGMAQRDGLDLVEINPKAVPPVCKIMDYGKFKYEKKKKENEARKHQSVVELKEIKFRPGTDDHDVNVKVRAMRRFLEEKNKVKVTLRFRGREIAHQDIGRALLVRITQLIADLGLVTQDPRSEGKLMTMIISPKEGAGGAAERPQREAGPGAPPAPAQAKPEAHPSVAPAAPAAQVLAKGEGQPGTGS